MAARFEDGAAVAAATVAYDPRERALGEPERWTPGHNVRASGLFVSVGGERVELQGPVEVVAGSRELRPGKPLESMPLATCCRVTATFPGARPHFMERVVLFRSLSPGDRVRVSGVLRREAATGEAGSRSAAARWTLVADGESASPSAERGLEIAFEGNPAVKGASVKRIAGWGIAGALAFLVVFALGGELALRSAQRELEVLAHENDWVGEVSVAAGDPIDPRAPPALPVTLGRTATALAAATPFHRGMAIERYSAALDRRGHADPAIIGQRVALHMAIGMASSRCLHAADVLTSHGQLEEAAALLARCDTGDVHLERSRLAMASFVRFSLGDFTAASELAEGSSLDNDGKDWLRFATRAHLLAGAATWLPG
ncbi:uncharacterized protein SOCE26_017420 [Sorangium cellulosum]|uniref:Uncharacterized protein n=1 Tax=Sorangium cellulosum TaxID=56 RepID=A0A2L0EM50_SORCE|nr:hypothetical protein [Sorangium cellulosum]AUX40342.1 uncharacterized protein SOCE26_017420 [Sorangium cellulosum]